MIEARRGATSFVSAAFAFVVVPAQKVALLITTHHVVAGGGALRFFVVKSFSQISTSTGHIT